MDRLVRPNASAKGSSQKGKKEDVLLLPKEGGMSSGPQKHAYVLESISLP